MSSDEEDYMSDKILSKCITEDTRPRLVRSRKEQKQIEVVAKKAKVNEEQKRKNKPNERERLEEGLKNAISTQNKGFALLAKMGYKEGESLGRTSKGITEPIAITIKSDRGGLGREAAVKELKEKVKEIRRKRLLERAKITEVSTEDFRRRMTKKAEERSTEIALGKCQRACEKLDQENEIEKPTFPWFWPDRQEKRTEEEDDDEQGESEIVQDNEEDIDYELIEKLEMITSYLRTSYNYCHWCGVHYNDIEDMEKNCPGLEKDDH